MKARVVQLVLDLFGPEPLPPELPKPAEPPKALMEGAVLPNTARQRLEAKVVLEWSSRLRKGWRIERLRTGLPRLVLPVRLQAAPESIWEALEQWVETVTKPARLVPKGQRRKVGKVVLEWLGPSPDRVPQALSQGVVLNLQELFANLNAQYFGGRLQAVVRWSPRIGGLSTHRALQTPEGVVHLITLSRGYNGEQVPRVAVEGVLYHEMLHIALPPKKGRGEKRVVHHKAFREAERAFVGYAQWRAWEQEHMGRHLRTLRKSPTKNHIA